MHFDNELGILEFVDLCIYDLTPLCYVISLALDNWSGSWVQVEQMVDHGMTDHRHVFARPSDYIFVGP